MSAHLYIGDLRDPLYYFKDATIETCSIVLSSSMSGDELAIDQLMPSVYSAAYIRVKFVPKDSAGFKTADGKMFYCYPGTGFLDKLPYGTPIWYYLDDTLIGKFYSKQVVRSGKTWFDIMAVSAVGILDGQLHYGGIYTGQTFQTVAADIIGDTFSFSCADDVAGINIYGWLPISSKRDNLHQMLFACGVVLAKDADGEMLFRYPESDAVKHVPDNRIFMGGSVDYLTPATRAEVTEHSFMALSGDETVTLYDNTQGGEVAENTLVSFQEAPVHDLSASGSLSIVESGVNYAIVSGSGILTGKRYTHITRVLRKDTGKSGEIKDISVTDATLVNVANSENVLQRVLAYYASARMTSCELMVGDEKPGDQISFNNPYSEPERAFLASMDIRASSFLRASCELITGYLPSGGGNNYTQVIVLEGSGTWVSPVSGKIRVAVIQGGQGGTGGHRGTDGERNVVGYDKEDGQREVFVPNSDVVGTGGAPGEPGSAGKVFVFSLNVTKGQSFSYSSGSGGIGGNGETETSEAQPGSEGGHSTFGSYTSADGNVVEGGYLDIINNVLYASSGQSGTSGSPGNVGGRTETSKGGGVLGGNPASGAWTDHYINKWYKVPWKSGGGGQGGNAYGTAGEAGETMVDTYEEDYANRVDSPHSGRGAKGGDGATPIKPSTPANIGTGGSAGHGGGGGATGAAFWCRAASIWISVGLWSNPGKGGNGGRGGDGAPGGIIIYL